MLALSPNNIAYFSNGNVILFFLTILYTFMIHQYVRTLNYVNKNCDILNLLIKRPKLMFLQGCQYSS